MPRSATIDEDDGWSTDFSLSDEEMAEPYLDHVEVTWIRPDDWKIILFKFFVFVVAVTSPLHGFGGLCCVRSDGGDAERGRTGRLGSNRMRRLVVRSSVRYVHLMVSLLLVLLSIFSDCVTGNLSSSGQEGWAPSAYLEPSTNVKSPCSSGTPSVSSQDSEQDHCLQWKICHHFGCYDYRRAVFSKWTSGVMTSHSWLKTRSNLHNRIFCVWYVSVEL